MMDGVVSGCFAKVEVIKGLAYRVNHLMVSGYGCNE
jgi:hypothetical protein